MLKYESKLIDPTPELVVATLTAAADAANRRCRSRLLEIDAAKARKFARRSAAEPEGWEMFRGGRGGVPASQVLASWWTDAASRKHVVVRGRRVEDRESVRLLRADELAERPPLWHAYPEYVCRRTTASGSEVVCACGCGVVGSPATLGWMGECCGPCSDRKEEAGPEGLRANVPGVLYGDRNPLSAVACSPDGNLVATVEGRTLVHLWNLRQRVRTTAGFGNLVSASLAFTADGRYLLTAGAGVTVGEALVMDAAADPPVRVESAMLGNALHVAPLPDPGLAVVHQLGWPTNDLAVVRIPTGEVVRRTGTPQGFAGSLATSADGRRVALSHPRTVIRDVATLAEVNTFGPSAQALAFSPDGERVYATDAAPVVCHEVVSGKQVARAVVNRRPEAYEYILSLAANPDGSAVYAAGLLGRLYALHPETLAVRAVFDWHLGPVRGLAVSADGSRLFTAGGDGCVKVWPIRDLLRGV
jgi:DNA-binding beta-propeller fold protein YncE